MKTWEEMENIQPLASKIFMKSIRKKRLSHAYIIQGGRGTGKKALVTLLAKVLFCENLSDVEPCYTCNICQRIDSGNYPDVHWIHPDGRTIKIEQIRRLQGEFAYSGLESEQKVYIIVGTETLTLNAANRLLKFLEEPKQKTTAFLLTENKESMIPTILSRCQLIDLQPLHPTIFQKQLQANDIPEKITPLLSTLTNHLDEAIEIYNDDWFKEAQKIILQWITIAIENPSDLYLYIHNHWIPHFSERDQLDRGLDLLMIAFRDVLYYHIGNRDSIAFLSRKEGLIHKAFIRFSQEKILTILKDILVAKRKNRQNVHPVLVIEQLALRI